MRVAKKDVGPASTRDRRGECRPADSDGNTGDEGAREEFNHFMWFGVREKLVPKSAQSKQGLRMPR